MSTTDENKQDSHADRELRFHGKLSGSENHKGFVLTMHKSGCNTFAIGEIYPFDSDGEIGEEHARRLVACWNRLLPFSTEEIENGVDLVALHRQLSLVRGALEGMLSAFEGKFSFNELAAFEQVACNEARKALDATREAAG